MVDKIEQRDFFISFNSADLAHAEAINAALREAGFTTYFHPIDIPPGGNIPKWMDDALLKSTQLLALFSPEYMGEGAVYSESERYARFWQDTRGSELKLVPVVLRQVEFTPLLAIYKRIDAENKPPKEAAAIVVAALKKPDEVSERKILRTVEALPAIFNVFYRPNPNFTGRFEAMESLQNSLREGNAAITAVAGMGGVGKTTLAAEYCHRFGSRYGGVWWVRGEQGSTMLADLQALAQELQVASGINVEDDARVCLKHLKSITQPWLMVYDNVPNADAIRDWLPTGAVRCIITSRSSGFDDVAHVTKLDQWSDEVTADYLLGRTGRDDKASALRLARTLGGLPLAAEQAAVFLKDRKGIAFDDYAREITRLIKEERTVGSKGEYPDTVYAAFVKSLEALDGMKSGKTALDLVRLCAFLSPDGVDIALLTVKWGREVLPAEFAAAMENTFAREDALATLATLSLLHQEEGPAGSVLIFHRLLLEVMRDWMGPELCNQWSGAAVQLIRSVFPSSDSPRTDTSVWPVCARLVPHVASLDLHAPHTGEIGQSLASLLNQAGLYFDARGDRTSSLEMAAGSVRIARLIDDNPLLLATALNNLAESYIHANKLDVAEEIYVEVLKIADAHLPEGDPRLGVWISNSAAVLRIRNDFAKAEPLLLRARDIILASHGSTSGDYANSLSNLGALYAYWADASNEPTHRASAKKFMLEALNVTSMARGLRHPETFNRYINVANLSGAFGDWSAAASHSARAAAISLSLDLQESSETEHIMSFLMKSWRSDGQHDRAARLEQRNIADLLPVIAQIEAEHRVWMSEDPKGRHFGPLSPFER